MKLFKNCPENYRKECDNCPLLKQCVKKKIKRKLLRFFRAHRQNFILTAVTIISFIVAIAIIYKNFDAIEAKATQNEKTVVKEEAFISKDSTEKKEVFISKDTTENKEVLVKKESVKQKVAVVKHTKKSNKKSNQTHKIAKSNLKKVKTAETKTPKKTNNSSLEISELDKKNMEKVVYAEARGEGFEGQIAVAAVILNRYEFYDRKKSITKLVTAPYQFADISNITQEMLDEYPDCKKAVEEALNGNDPTEREFPEGARYFYEPNLVEGHQKEIREGIRVLKIGNHCFHNDFNE